MLSTKCALAARVDACKTKPNGEYGVKLLQEIQERFGKLQAPGQSRMSKILPKPDDKPRKKRAGKKFQSQNKKYEMTMMRNQKNQVAFGPGAQNEDMYTGETYGLLGRSG